MYDSQAQPSFNASPGTYRPVLHIQHGERRVDDVFWSYRPAWAAVSFGPGVLRAPKENREEAGFVLVTADSLGGMVDIHDRRPVAVSAEDARRWLDPALTPDDAAHLARTAMLGTEVFEWVPVSREVNRAGTDGPQLIEPVNPADSPR